jgi:NAD(P)H-dependent flavin oxidoreductase YrpB (nitropropane dioxygenase family)
MTSMLETRVSETLGVPYPIFGFTHSPDAVTEVSLAGGIGVLGATRNTPDEIRQMLKDIRERIGDRLFGVDLVIPRGMPEQNNREDIEAQLPTEHKTFVSHLYEKYKVPAASGPGMRSRFVRSEESARRQLEVVLESDVNVLALGVGSPPEVIDAAHDAGKTVVALVGSPRNARHAVDGGADIIVAQGYDAGGHTGKIGTFSLISQIVDMAGDIPVVAAGGVATGRHIAASFALGAEGVWMGSAWLFAKENHTEPVILQKLIEAGAEDTLITRADSGKTLRQIKTAWSEEWEQPEAPDPLRMPFQDILIGDLLGAIGEHQVEPLMHTPAGQGIANYDAETTVAEIMAGLISEAEGVLERGGAARRPEA